MKQKMGSILFVGLAALLYVFYLEIIGRLLNLLPAASGLTVLWLFLLIACVPLAAVSAHVLIRAIKKYC